MEEDGGVKAPVTRLRRRLSVEPIEDTKSPSAPSTPTKKRGRPLAAKPQLELIDENVPQDSPKRAIRKSIARDIVEPAEEKPLTPSRRSTRVKSNTSILSETAQPDTPRARRAAARRNSQVGSDNEAPLTPARTRRTRKDSTSSIDKQAVPSNETPVTPGRTRRTRKDSTSSVDKQVDNEPENKPLIEVVISEEPEHELAESATCMGTPDDTNTLETSPGSFRQSPRLQAKKNRKSSSKSDKDDLVQENETNTVYNDGYKLNENGLEVVESKDTSRHEDTTDGRTDHLEKDKLSISSANLIKDLDKEPKKKSSNMNKSTSALEYANNPKTTRHRTKSWTTLTVPQSNEGIFYSDNESTKKKIKKHDKIFNILLTNQAASGDSALNTTENEISEIQKENIESITKGSLKKKKRKENSAEESYTPNKSGYLEKRMTETSKPKGNESNKQNAHDMNNKSLDSSATELLFQTTPGKDIQTLLLIEDSDSNTESIGKIGKEKQLNLDDQCVPVVDHQLQNQETPQSDTSVTKSDLNNQDLGVFNSMQEKPTDNNSCEPMDVDLTIPENVVFNDSSNLNKVGNAYAQEITENNANKSSNKSKRKSSLSNAILQDLDVTGNENKSTLVLSQIKDVSSTDRNVSKSLQESNIELSKSMNIPNIGKEVVNQNLSINYLTSTPVQHKEFKKSTMRAMNTSVITPHNDNKKDIVETNFISKKEACKFSKASDSSNEENEDGTEEESSKDNNEFVDDEAEDAGDDYESGDSQNEDEKQYERENEIIDNGLTLTSEEDISDDSDYEKDSFVVSSDEEDNELLSGSGDDLDMSDNELTMSAKSKKKYNESSLKKQKNASREMFEARHKLDKVDKTTKMANSKKNLTRADSAQESENEIMVPPKKNKRMRLDSTWESSVADEAESKDKKADVTPSDDEDIGLKKKKKSKRLSESISESVVGHKGSTTSEKKDSTFNESVTDEIGLKNKKKCKRLSESVCEEASNEKVSVSFDKYSTINEYLADDIGYKKKKSKRLSESICNESITNEKEITVCDDNTLEKDDPLAMQIKQEPKTPQKGLDISTIHFTDRDEMEQVHVDENVSMMNLNDSLDPLHVTMAQEDHDHKSSSSSDHDDSSLSENEEITKNYDSVLQDLNKDTNVKVKSCDISLNLEKKTKKVYEPIIEQLNITQTKKPKAKKKQKDADLEAENTTTNNKSVGKNMGTDFEDETSDSIDLKLLLSEDSNQSEKSAENGQNREEFIPLKRTEGKTNILENMIDDDNVGNKTLLNTSSKKNNKNRNSSQNNGMAVADETDGDNVFFIDTTGMRADMSQSMNNSQTTSSKKSKKLIRSFAQDVEPEVEIDTVDVQSDEGPAEVYYKSEKSKTIKQKKARDAVEQAINLSATDKTPQSDKKKKISESLSVKESGTIVPASLTHDTSLSNSKLPKNSTDESTTAQTSKDQNKVEQNDVTSGKKRKRKLSANVKDVSEGQAEVVDTSRPSNKKKKLKMSQHEEIETSGAVTDNDNVPVVIKIREENKKQKKKGKREEANTQLETDTEKKAISKKRKRDEDNEGKESKIVKENFLDRIHVPRLPTSIINRLEDKPRKDVLEAKKSKVISTADFIVEETKKKKPSNFLEESVYLNDSEYPVVQKKANIKKPKVLPFIPTASTSDSGFTTNFQVNIIPKKMEFVAQSSMNNFKSDYMQNKKIKKLRTYELYKLHRNVKLTKY